MAKYDDVKLEGLGLLKAGLTPKEVSRQLQVPYPKVLKWKPELEEIKVKEDIETIMDVDQAVVHEVAEGVKAKLLDLVEEGDELVDATLEKVDKLLDLQAGLQGSGLKLITKINRLVDDCNTPDQISTLVDSIAKLQTAFFAKGANVNVLNAMGGQPSSNGIDLFKSLQRNA